MPAFIVCPDAEKFSQLLHGTASAEEIESFAQHLEKCSACAHRIEETKCFAPIIKVVRQTSDGSPLPVGARLEGLMEKIDKMISSGIDTMANGEGGDNPASSSVGTPTSAGLRFRILRPHAKGGLGQVFVARDEELHREVALKEIQERFADDRESRARFLLEAEITGSLEHPGIVPVYGLGQYDDGRPFYAMRFIRGDSLQDAIKRFHSSSASDGHASEPTLGLRQLLGRFINVCQAIQYAHDRGVLHRDLKPSNIMLGKYGETLVVDWGLAKPVQNSGESGSSAMQADESALRPSSASGNAETVPGTAMGTPQYMSPEQAAGRLDQLGPPSDVYSLGATLFCLLTGKAPVEDKELAIALRKVQKADFPKPRQLNRDIDPALESVCMKAMALKIADRYTSARDLADDVECWLADKPVSAWPEPLRVKARRWMGRNRTLVSGAAAAVFVGVVSLVLATVMLTAAYEEKAAETDKVQKANEKLADEHNKVQDANTNLEKTNQELATLAIKERKAKEAETEARIKADAAAIAERNHLYVSDMNRVQAHWRLGEVPQVLALLERHLPKPEEFDRRRFEWFYYWRLCHTCQHTIEGLPAPVRGIAYAPDGKTLAIACEDRYTCTVLLWNPADRSTKPALLTKESSPARALAFSPDGITLAWASGQRDEPGTVKLWDVSNRKLKHIIKAHRHPVTCLAFSPDGGVLASASSELVSKGWEDLFNVMGFKADGDKAAGGVKLWNVSTGIELPELQGANGGAMAVSFSSNGKEIAGAMADQSVKIWSFPERHSTVARRLQFPVLSVAFHPGGKTMAAVGGVGHALRQTGQVVLWKGDGSQEPISLLTRNDPVIACAYSPDGRWLASVGFDKTVRLWHGLTGVEAGVFKGHTDVITSVAFAPDGMTVASGGRDRTVRLWNLSVPQEWMTLHESNVGISNFNLLWSPDNKTVAEFSAGKKSCNLCDVASRIACPTPEFLGFSPSGEAQAYGLNANGSLLLWNVDKGRDQPFASLKLPVGTGLLGAMAISSDKTTVATLNPEPSKQNVYVVALWEVKSGRELWKKDEVIRGPRVFRFSPDAKKLVLTDFNNTLKVWDVPTGRELGGWFCKDGVGTVAFSPNSDKLTTGDDGRARLWDTASVRQLGEFGGHKGEVWGMAFSPDGRVLATGSRSDNRIKLWDLETGEELLTLTGPNEVYHLSFSPNGEVLAAWMGRRLVLFQAPRESDPQKLNQPLSPRLWHRLQADAAKAGGDDFGHRFHAERLAALNR